jgi:hypothetical protein
MISTSVKPLLERVFMVMGRMIFLRPCRFGMNR